MSRLFLALLAAGALALGETTKTYFSPDPAQQQQLWDDFKATFGRTYESRDDEAARFRIFVDNLKLIDERNAAEKAASLLSGSATTASRRPCTSCTSATTWARSK